MSHPTRLRAMRILSERVASPREIASVLEEPINNVAYHIKVLKRLDCIELVGRRQVHGGRVAESFYRATQRPYWDASAWEQLDESQKLGVTGAIMHQMSEDIAEAMAHGTFNDFDDNHISRSPMIVDQDGWREVVSLLDQTMEELMDIQDRVNARNAGDGLLHTHVEIIQFCSPPPKSGITETNL
ncbi:MAG: helix-turn-helix domain-containing protein [Solirubrobacterales bacterium]